MSETNTDRTKYILLIITTVFIAILLALYFYSGQLLFGNILYNRSDSASISDTAKDNPIPDFYKEIAKENEDFSIIEYPVIIQDRYNPSHEYRTIHNKKLLSGYFISHAVKKHWREKSIFGSKAWPAEILLSRLENNKINFSRTIDLFNNFIDLYNIKAIRNSGATHIILHKNIRQEILTLNDGLRDDKAFSDEAGISTWEHMNRYVSHFNAYYKRYFGDPVHEDDLLIVFNIKKEQIHQYRNAMVTFQFDHPFITQYTIAKPLFDSKGIKASLMMNTNEIGRPKYYMSWDQLKEMYDEGWEVGAHTVTHPDMRTLNEAEIRYELSQAKEILSRHGIENVKNFAYPYNWYNINSVYIASEYYRSARTSVAQTDFSINPRGIHPYELSGYEARINLDNIADAYKYVDKAQKEGRWLIFIMHEFIDGENTDYILSKEITDIKALEMLINYIQKKHIPIVTTNQALDYYIGSE